MEGIVLGPGTRPRPERWPDTTGNEVEQHSLDWKAVLKGATISSVSWSSAPTGLAFSASTISGNKTLITITPPALLAGQEYAIHVKMTDSAGFVHEIEPPVQIKVQPGGVF